MQRVALFSTGIRSDISTDLAIAEQLATIGLETVICAARSDDKARVLANGVAFVHYQRVDLAALSAVFDQLSDQSEPAQTADKALHGAPVLYLCHAELHGEQLMALARELPVVAIDSHVSVDRRSGVPPMTSVRKPSPGITLVAWLQWRRLLKQRLMRSSFQAQVDWLKSLCAKVALDFNAIATFNHWHPIRFRTVPYWCLAATEFDFVPEAPRKTEHLGPQIAQRLCEPQTDSEAYLVLKDWIDRAPNLVYCSFGSLLSDQRLLLEVVRAAQRRDDVQWLLGVNGLASIPDLGGLTDNVRILYDVPQRAVLARCKTMVTGAGIATINECILSKVPMVVYSLGVLDQNGNAARVAWHGLGVVGNRDTDTASDILEHIERVQGPSYRTRLDAMAAHYNRYTTDRSLATAITRVLHHKL